MVEVNLIIKPTRRSNCSSEFQGNSSCHLLLLAFFITIFAWFVSKPSAAKLFIQNKLLGRRTEQLEGWGWIQKAFHHLQTQRAIFTSRADTSSIGIKLDFSMDAFIIGMKDEKGPKRWQLGWTKRSQGPSGRAAWPCPYVTAPLFIPQCHATWNPEVIRSGDWDWEGPPRGRKRAS